MDRQHSCRSQVLDHRGLVAGLFDELGSGEVMDHATPQPPERRIVTAGHAVKAMALNGLGFVNQRLYLVPRFFQEKPLSRLLAPCLIEAEHLNDEALARAVATLYEYGVTALYSLMAATAAERLGLTPRFAHLASTSVHVDGRYNSDHAPDEQVVHITRGCSRDHRPDLNQVLLEWMVEHQAGMPVLMKPLSGNRRDAPEFGQVVQAPMAQLHPTYGTTSLVADRALYSADNRQKLSETRLQWITRGPATLSDAQAALTQADPQTMAPLLDGYRYRALTSTYGGVAQRWVLIFSEHRLPQAQRTADNYLFKQSEQEVKAFKKLGRTALACAADAPQARSTFENGLQATFLAQRTARSTPRYGRRGRPGPDTHPAQVVYAITARWLHGSLSVRHASTNTVVSGWPLTSWMTPSSRPGSSSRATKAKGMRNAAFVSSRAHAFWPRPCLSKSPSGSWPS